MWPGRIILYMNFKLKLFLDIYFSIIYHGSQLDMQRQRVKEKIVTESVKVQFFFDWSLTLRRAGGF